MNSQDPQITVYITNHNYARFIGQAIESVLNQTLQDFELIIIDDGSTDNSREIIESHSEHEKIVTIFQQNKGLNVSNNIALRAARGRYIMRLDADDYLDENALMVLAGVLDRSPEFGLVFPDYFLVDEEGNILEMQRRHNFDEVTLLDQPAHGACTLIRRHCLLDLGGYNQAFTCQDGYEMWIRFIQLHRVQNVNLPLFYYRQHPQSLTRNDRKIQATRARITEVEAKRRDRHLTAVAIVPVRGRNLDPGSSALKRLGGRALIDWTLHAALESTRLSGVIVTTPDKELLDHVARNYGERVLRIRRERRLAMPNTLIEDSLLHALTEYSQSYPAPDVVVVLYIECPFRTAQHIDHALGVMELFDTDTVIAVRPTTELFYRHNGGSLEPLRKTRMLRLEREELYRGVGQMCAVRRTFLEEQRQVVGGILGHIIIDRRAAWRLQFEWDWEVAESWAGQ